MKNYLTKSINELQKLVETKDLDNDVQVDILDIIANIQLQSDIIDNTSSDDTLEERESFYNMLGSDFHSMDNEGDDGVNYYLNEQGL